jgi:hypothetical protein
MLVGGFLKAIIMINNNLKIIKRIADIVAAHFDINVRDMFPNSRENETVEKRQIFHYMATKHTKASLREIGDFSKVMGRNISHNHATVLYSVKQVQGYMDVDKEFYNQMKQLESKIYKAVSLINKTSRIRDVQVQAIIDTVFGDENLEFVELVHLLIEKIYENKNKEELSHLIFLQNKMNNERIYKTSQIDTRLGMV